MTERIRRSISSKRMTTFDLFSSVRDGNTDIVRRLLQSKQCRAKLNERNEWGDTALHLAAELGNSEICQMLIAGGASVTVRNNRGETCLHRAAVGGHVEAVRAIVGRDQDPEAVNSQNDAGYTALHHAAKHGSKELIDILIKAGADRMLENNAGETPYMVAHKFEQYEAEKLLLNMEQEHADQAIRCMNRKDKEIVKAYYRALKYASHQESRVRIMLVGDSGSGKTSLKKTLLGEMYNPLEKPSTGINADPSITRIQFRQYREWVMQQASKADAHRLNLEYTDTLINYVIHEVRKRKIQDDGLDNDVLQIEKKQTKSVTFAASNIVISAEEDSLAYEEIAQPSAVPPSTEDQNSCGEHSDETSGASASATSDFPSSSIASSVSVAQDSSNSPSLVASRQDDSTVASSLQDSGTIASSTQDSGSIASSIQDNGSIASSLHNGSTIASSVDRDGSIGSSLRDGCSIQDGSSAASRHDCSSMVSSLQDGSSIGPSSTTAVSSSYQDDGGTTAVSDVTSPQGGSSIAASRQDGIGSSSASYSSCTTGSAVDDEVFLSAEAPPLKGPHNVLCSDDDEVLDVTSNQNLMDRIDGLVQRDSLENEDDRLARLVEDMESTEAPSEVESSHSTKPGDSSNQITESNELESEELDLVIPIPTPDIPRPLSRLLVEKIPPEILKRMVIRWPVGEESHNCSSLSKKRLMITVWDSSGDPLQQNFIPFFFSSRSIFVTTYNLQQELDSPSETYTKRNLVYENEKIPTNGEVLEDWIGCITPFTKPIPSEPFRCTSCTPVLPPLVLACTHIDCDGAGDVDFHQFFSRKSFGTYRKHLVESNSPCALGISNKYESQFEEDYSGHHILRREIDYLARQMPYSFDNIPVQWVRFEQLLYGLIEQKKVILLYEDLNKYISEHCQLSGVLQVFPVLSHFHEVGVLIFFHRHPLLSNLVIVKPQWMIDALSAVITSIPGKWITGEAQVAFLKLSESGTIEKDMLSLAYRCARLPHRYWNELLFIMNCMDIICCHPSLHERKAIYLPCLVAKVAPEDFFFLREGDPTVLSFSVGDSVFPIALYNQLVVRCIRCSQYAPVLYREAVHFRLNKDHHLLLRKRRNSVDFIVQSNIDLFCMLCKAEDEPHSLLCLSNRHVIGDNVEFMPSDPLAVLTKLKANANIPHLMFSDDENLRRICPQVLSFLNTNVAYLSDCWFYGIELGLVSGQGEERTAHNQQWKHTVLNKGTASSDLAIWFV